MANIAEVRKRLQPTDWQRLREPQIPEPVAQFAAWTEALLTKVRAEESLIAIQSAKVLLLDRFMQWQADMPKRSRLKPGSAEAPTIWSVFAATYDHLREMELTLVPVLQAPTTSDENAPLSVYIGEQSS